MEMECLCPQTALSRKARFTKDSDTELLAEYTVMDENLKKYTLKVCGDLDRRIEYNRKIYMPEILSIMNSIETENSNFQMDHIMRGRSFKVILMV